MVGPPIGVDDQIGGQPGPGRLDQNVDALGGPCAAYGVADNPADRIACGDRAGTDELFSVLKRDVGNLTRGCVKLVECTLAPGILLDGIEEPVAHRLHSRGRVRPADAKLWIAGLGRGRRFDRLQLPGKWQRFGYPHNLDGAGLFGFGRSRSGALERQRFRLRMRGRTGREGNQRGCEQGVAGCLGQTSHCDSSFDQFRALMNTPRGFFRRASGVRGVRTTTVAIADQRSVAVRLPS